LIPVCRRFCESGIYEYIVLNIWNYSSKDRNCSLVVNTYRKNKRYGAKLHPEFRQLTTTTAAAWTCNGQQMFQVKNEVSTCWKFEVVGLPSLYTNVL